MTEPSGRPSSRGAAYFPHRAAGPPDGPAVVFLHGFLGRGADWEPIMAGLADRFRCLAPDLPGHGAHPLSDYAKPLAFSSLSRALLAWLDALDLSHVTLVGYSLGGRLALYTTVHHPERITALVLESANPGIAEPQARAARAALDDRRATAIRQHGMAAFLDAWYAMPLFASLHRHPELLARLKRERQHIPPEYAARVIAELSPGRQPSLWHALPKIQVPTLLLCGRLDPKYPHLLQQMAALMPQAEWRCIPHAGHNVHAEQPQAFLQAVRAFLRS